MQFGLVEALSKVFDGPAKRLEELLREIKENLEQAVNLLTEIQVALTEEPEPPAPLVKLRAVPKAKA